MGFVPGDEDDQVTVMSFAQSKASVFAVVSKCLINAPDDKDPGWADVGKLCSVLSIALLLVVRGHLFYPRGP